MTITCLGFVHSEVGGILFCGRPTLLFYLNLLEETQTTCASTKVILKLTHVAPADPLQQVNLFLGGKSRKPSRQKAKRAISEFKQVHTSLLSRGWLQSFPTTRF